MTTLFRVENPLSKVGLWYDEDGNFTEFIKTLDDAQCKDVPMDFDPDFAGGWASACDNLPDMQNWFAAKDIAALQEIGYGLYGYEVAEYRIANGHALFRKDTASEKRLLPITLLEV